MSGPYKSPKKFVKLTYNSFNVVNNVLMIIKNAIMSPSTSTNIVNKKYRTSNCDVLFINCKTVKKRTRHVLATH